VWEQVAERLPGHGLHAIVPDPPPAAFASPADVLDWLVGALPSAGEFILVPHSNAGLYVPAIAARRSVRGFVFVDAVLPPRDGRVHVAPDALVNRLRASVGSDGLLRPWTSWWPEEDVAALFPDRQSRYRIEAEQRRLPLAYLTSEVDIAPGWDRTPWSAYMAFGDTYAEEIADARGRGWRTVVVDGSHLHMLCDPDRVVELLTEIILPWTEAQSDLGQVTG
jgi:hypothetical protein